MKFSGKIIISDIDSTYTGTSGQRVSANAEKIKYFTENGGLFTFASGRVEFNLPFIVPDFESLVNAPCIFANGSYLYDCKTQARTNELTIDGAPLVEVLEEISSLYPDIGIRVNYKNGYLTPCLNDTIKKDLKKYMSLVRELPLSQMAKLSWNKIVFSGASDDLAIIADIFRQRFGDEYYLSKSCSFLLEALNKNATKGNQLLYLKKLLGNCTSYAIGDYENDIDMLKKADISACPSSALQKVIDLCDICVCSADEGAIAGLIEYIENN